MDIEKLSKSQIVLLTLLVSFMTSIATGIVTVSLMQQAPPEITQTVSKVIEHTVEKVAPNQPAAVALVTAKPTKAEDPPQPTLTSAVTTAEPSVVRLYSTDDTPVFLGLGVAVGPQVIATDASIVEDTDDAIIMQPGGNKIHVFVHNRNDTLGVVFMGPASTSSTVSFTPAALAPAPPALGQTVIVLAGKAATRIGIGAITALSFAPDKDTQLLETNLDESDILPGSPIINTDGSIIGVSTAPGRASSRTGFVSASALLKPSGSASISQ